MAHNLRNGFDIQTGVFHSLRPTTPLPPKTDPLSAAAFYLSLLNSSSLPPYPAIIDAFSSFSLSFPSFLSQSASLAGALRSSPYNLSVGSVALIFAPTLPSIPILYFALNSIGVVIAPSNPASTSAELSHQITLSKPSIAFSISSLSSKIPFMTKIPLILLDSPSFNSLLSSKLPPAPLPPIKQSDTAAILYSSGTTGRLKGVVLTHRNLIACIVDTYAARIRRLKEDVAAGKLSPPQPVALFTIPLFHVFGFFMIFRALSLGETTVLMERFEFEAMLKAVEKHRVIFIPAAPPLVLALAKSPMVSKFDLSSLQFMGVGGAPLGRQLAEQFAMRFPHVELVQGFGLTESTGIVSCTLGADEAKMYGSAGRLGVNVEAKIVDLDTGKAVGPAQRGELWLRGPVIMKGYVNNDEATAATLDREGWLKTGDLCYFNGDGYLYIVDRLKELIKYKAYQVPPAELELILQTHPGIADAAVIPYPNEEAGEIPMAFVVRQPGANITGKQVMDFVAKQVAPYKKIRRVSFINAIPKSAAGKILRRELAKQYLSNTSSKL